MTFKYSFIFLPSTLMLNAVRERRIEFRVEWAKRIGRLLLMSGIPSSDSEWQRTVHCAVILYSRKCFSERSATVWLDVSLGKRPGTLLCWEGPARWGRTPDGGALRQGGEDPLGPFPPTSRSRVEISNSMIQWPIRKEWSWSWFVILGISFQDPSHSG